MGEGVWVRGYGRGGTGERGGHGSLEPVPKWGVGLRV